MDGVQGGGGGALPPTSILLSSSSAPSMASSTASTSASDDRMAWMLALSPWSTFRASSTAKASASLAPQSQLASTCRRAVGIHAGEEECRRRHLVHRLDLRIRDQNRPLLLLLTGRRRRATQQLAGRHRPRRLGIGVIPRYPPEIDVPERWRRHLQIPGGTGRRSLRRGGAARADAGAYFLHSFQSR